MSPVVFGVSPRRLGCAFVGPAAIVLGLSACVLGVFALGELLARPITPAEATEALRLHLSFQLSSDMQADLRARGLAKPDLELARRWAAGLERIRATSVVAVSRRPSIFWFLARRTWCAARMEVEQSSAGGLPSRQLRYFRIACGRLGYPRIVGETGAWDYRVPL